MVLIVNKALNRVAPSVQDLLLSEKEVSKKSYRNCNAQVELLPTSPKFRDLDL